ncbi:tRNA glutamyl-Q(34) synthetase GluQRS [Alicyclobacillus shizuokensis]|uniref:tRNA glutamyl-Q(34) synthetase GluQRS n=1 Tax=Alicyclobacillus shizuokensis TaxID=392014 RepID=UPI00082A3880|nr:tRNA glutamyl-Q(34) synthetase GluQRS [Alicyclobacillus shizuokensis]
MNEGTNGRETRSLVRGRFAPTPSGRLHIGNALVALLAWLQVRQAGGEFVLRIEDIDRPRCREEYVADLLTDLRWLGLDWDEGPDVGGPYGPYRQRDRSQHYEEALAQLEAGGWLYPCFCSRTDLARAASAPHGLAAEGPAYPGTCRHLSAAERIAKAQQKRPALRFHVPDDAVEFHDVILGKQRFQAGAGGDFIVRRADSFFAYQLAVVVDDAAMRITDVLRGADLLDSTPRQVWLYEALGWPVPRFAHAPLVTDAAGRRLSKREKSLHLAALREAGVPPERVVGQLAYWAGLIDRLEDVRPGELMGHFCPHRLPASVTPAPETWRLGAWPWQESV